jgi:choline-sulfatase
MSVLKEKDLLNNTWIIYNSDHGEMLGDHMLSHKIVFYEGAIHIPLIVRPPSGIKGWKSQNLTDHLDIAASFIEIAGAKPLKGSDGCSFIPLIKERNNNFEQQGKDLVLSEVLGFSMVRNERYKLAFKTNTRRPVEFYDLKKDPNELTNLVKDPSYEPLRKDLLKTYCNNFLNR